MAQVITLNIGDVMAIRNRLSHTLMAAGDHFGGDKPLHAGNLASAVGRQTTGFGGEQKYKTVPEFAATLLYGLAMNHAFENGNKRTALVSALVLLQRNKLVLVDATEEDLFKLVTDMVKHELPVSGEGARDDLEVAYVADWFAKRSRDLRLGDRLMSFKKFRSLLEAIGCTFDVPDRNSIKVRRGGYSFGMGYPRANFTVDVPIIKAARKALHLDEIHGFDSGSFYNLDGAVDEFVNFYRNLMRRLATTLTAGPDFVL